MQEYGADGEATDAGLTDRGLTDQDLTDGDLIDLVRALEELKSAAAAAQARATAAFDASQQQAQARAGIPAAQFGRGIGAQIALARRESPHRGGRYLGLGKALTYEMPHTLAALSAGVLSEWRATLLVRETACLEKEDRRRVDALVCGNPSTLEGLGDRRLIARIRTLTQAIDPASQTRRHAKAVADRYVSSRPAPDTMAYLTGLLPAAQGVAVFAALSRAASSLRASGDERGMGQIMADTLVERITGQATATQVPVEVHLVMTNRTLFGSSFGSMNFRSSTSGPAAVGPNAGTPGTPGTTDTTSSTSGDATQTPWQDEPAYLPGYGIVPGQWAADLITDALGGMGQRPPTARYPRIQHNPDDRLPPGRRETPRGRPDDCPDISAHNTHDQAQVTLRRLYLEPATGELVAMDSKARYFPPALARLIRSRDQTCRTPWCDAPIRHIDHIRPHAEEGPTSYANGQGLCEACNHAKEAPGWKARATDAPGQRHTVRTITPTGHSYRSVAPPLPGASSR
ncbi:HNH endonuclease signature motif containing protein [Arthrobacter sp. Helios]|uniref:HNH endonuclease n=1 Tax=Arthrobacter sp. Helios TaxID=2828862 RepID=UPI00206C7F2A|nr:HNH endonuclease signature motif containing protein [Arthrobacter sp. Helios]UPO78114.1 HNH endonuclease [Arthrobacter sp. Helios]